MRFRMHSVKYIRGQIEHAIRQLEEITGKKFDHDRFKEVMKISAQTATWWKKATDLAAAQPSPFNGFDLFNYMAVIVCMRGKQEGLDSLQAMGGRTAGENRSRRRALEGSARKIPDHVGRDRLLAASVGHFQNIEEKWNQHGHVDLSRFLDDRL